MTHFLGDHSQLLKIDEAVDLGVVPQVDEGQVLFDHREEGDLRENRGKG